MGPWPTVNITVDHKAGLQLNSANAVMSKDGGITWVKNSAPQGGFLTQDLTTGKWIWNLKALVWPAGSADILNIPAIITVTGPITVLADLREPNPNSRTYDIEASGSYTFLSVKHGPCPPTAAGTVPMQTTGAPLALAALGLLSIIGGTVYGKLR